MKILVTGAAGFIGSNFVHHVSKTRPSWQIVSLDLLTYAGNLENITSLIESKKTTFVKLDISDVNAIEELFAKERFDLVFHFAAESHVDRSILGAQEFVQTNVMGTQVLLDSALRNKIKRFIHVSTDEVYGSLGPTGRFYETTPLDPTSPYSASKAASDLMVLACEKTHKLDAVVTRCTNNYGPYQFPEKLIPLFVTNLMEGKKVPLYGDGMNVRSWIYVEDHCEAVLLVGEKGRSGEVYNIGGTETSEVSNKQVTETILKLLGKSPEFIEWVADRPAHDRRYAVSIDKIKKELGWEPRTSFDQGLAHTVEWYKENIDWWQKIKSGAYLEYYQQNYGKR